MLRRIPVLRPQINVTPLIDVILVLLIIFMIVTPLMDARGVLPVSANAAARPEGPDDITLGIDAGGAYFLSVTQAGVATGMRAVVPGSLGPRLAALYAHRTRDRILYLKADRSLDFHVVARAITIARRSGVRVVGAVTERRVPPRR